MIYITRVFLDNLTLLVSSETSTRTEQEKYPHTTQIPFKLGLEVWRSLV